MLKLSNRADKKINSPTVKGYLGNTVPPAPSPFLTGLLADYEGLETNGTFIDATGRGNDLTVIQATAPGSVLSAAPGIQSYSRSYTAAFGNTARRADNPDLRFNTGDFTLEAWIWRSGGGPGGQIVVVKSDAGPLNDFVLYTSGGAIRAGLYTDTAPNYFEATRPLPSTLAWHQVLVDYNATTNTLSIAVDNGVAGTVAVVGNINGTAAPFVIGGYINATFQWDGRICPVRKWDVLFDASAKSDLYNSGFALMHPFSTAPTSANPRQYSGFPHVLRLASGLIRIYEVHAENHTLDNSIVRQMSTSDFAAFARGDNLETGQSVLTETALELANGDVLRGIREGFPTFTNYFKRSIDGGDTWGAAIPVANPLTDFIILYGRLRQTAGGRLLTTVYGQNLGERNRSTLFYSDDDGDTWDLLSTIAYDNILQYNETCIVSTGGDNWLAVIRADDDSFANPAINARYATSADNGATWSALADIGFSLHSPELVYGGTDLFLFYRNFGSTRTSYRKSVDNGVTWGAEVIVLQDVSADCAYPSAVYDGVNICLAYYRTVGTSVNVWKKSAATM